MAGEADVVGDAACLRTLVVFAVIVSPLYLLLRFFVRSIRQAYGFEPDVRDDGQPLRICASCHNTVMERDFAHCPYCGAPMPDAQDSGEV